MAVTKKQDNEEKNKKEPGKKDAGKAEGVKKSSALRHDKKDSARKDPVLKQDKKDVVAKKNQPQKSHDSGKDKKEAPKKEPARSNLPVKKERVNYLEKGQKFVRGTLNELKKVHWPNRKEVTIYTAVVLVAVALVAVLIWVFDSALSVVLGRIIQR